MDVAAKGLDGVIVGDTELSLVDGEKGLLIYRGYNVDDLVDFTFEDICHLFLFDKLPNKDEALSLTRTLNKRLSIPKPVQDFIKTYAKNDNPMSTLRTAVSMLSAFRKEPSNSSKEELRDCALDLIAKNTTIAACIARVRKGHEILEPREDIGLAKNFLYLSTGELCEDIVEKTMNTALILHIDHGFNVSTFTARVVTSSLSDMISAVTAAIGSLKGPLHGGANTAVMKMLMEIKDVENIEPWLDNAITNKKKIMGFGHRVYKVMDPRAKHLKKLSKEWGERAKEKKWFLMSEKLEALMMEKKRINPNVDFYSASTYYTMGIEPDMYTPIFAVARMVGWTSHVMEQLKDNRIIRPEANYIGELNKKVKQ